MIHKVCIFLIRGLRPLLGPAVCKFWPTCTDFAVQELQEKKFFTACFSIIKRLLSCNPFTK